MQIFRKYFQSKNAMVRGYVKPAITKGKQIQHVCLKIQ